MHVLICDDDPSTRFVIKRLLTQNLGCTTSECVDGVEALRRLDEEDADLLMLDVEMPNISGVEVLEVIRASQRLKSLPVLMLSKERREDIVLQLVKLGVEGYILKPPRTEKVLAALERLRGRLSGRSKAGRGSNVTSVRLDPDNPALLVEGNLDYRHFFITEGTKQGPIMEAASGAAALSQFRQTPVSLIFVGADLGILSAELLVPKLRAMAGTQPLRIVGVLDEKHVASAENLFDDVMVRSYIPEKFKLELRRFARVPGPLAAVTALTGDLVQGVTSATRQVFGMMLDADIEPLEDATEAAPMVAAVTDISIQQRYVAQLGIRATVPAITAIAARMLGMEVADISSDDYMSTAQELANLISGRMHAVLDERSVTSDCSLPRLDAEAVVWDADTVADSGIVVKFKVPAIGAALVMSVSVTDLLADAGQAAAMADDAVA